MDKLKDALITIRDYCENVDECCNCRIETICEKLQEESFNYIVIQDIKE